MQYKIELIKNIFLYDEHKAILFTQLFFWGFFGVVLLIYSLIYKQNRLRTYFLFGVSLFFYFKTSGLFLLLLMYTICIDYLLGNLIAKNESQKKKKLYLGFSVVSNLFFLCFFKYAYFFTESYNQIMNSNVQFFNHFAQLSNNLLNTGFSVNKMMPAIGVSFFTFQSLSYTIDLYRNKITPVKNILDYGFFVCFFPHLVAGPIVKANEFIHQIYKPYSLTKLQFNTAVFWILNGFGKKIVADYIAVNFIDRIFDSPNLYSGVEVIFGIFGYSLQIYMDFSGYTDMAIGIALILGYTLKTNFNSPYKATSTSEFWKRWHISLSSWLQEYLYIPLGGNKKGTIGSYIAIAVLCLFMALLSANKFFIYALIIGAIVIIALSILFKKIKQSINTNINLMVTMLLGGLWHGSSWLFLIWGGLNGLGLIAHKIWKEYSPFKKTNDYATKFMLIFITLTFISFTRIFFRSDSMETVNVLFDRMKNHLGLDLLFEIIYGYRGVFAIIILGYLIHWIPEKIKINYRTWFAEQRLEVISTIIIICVFLLYQLMSGDMQPFIYFQF